jgi:hypothetical protein
MSIRGYLENKALVSLHVLVLLSSLVNGHSVEDCRRRSSVLAADDPSQARCHNPRARRVFPNKTDGQVDRSPFTFETPCAVLSYRFLVDAHNLLS